MQNDSAARDVVLDDGEAQLTSAATCSSGYSSTSAAGSEPAVVCLGAAADNYDVVYIDGVVMIAKAPQQITLSPDTLVDNAKHAQSSAA